MLIIVCAICAAALFATVLVALFILNRKGLTVTHRVKAVYCQFSPGKTADKAVVESCTGRMRHVGRFNEDRIYEFNLDIRLSSGDVNVFLLDASKQPMLCLNSSAPAARIELHSGSKYYLCWEFVKATGSCILSWA